LSKWYKNLDFQNKNIKGGIFAMKFFSRSLFFSLWIVMVVALISCGEPKTNQQVSKQDKTNSAEVLIEKTNEELSEHPLVAFGYKSYKLNTRKWEVWAKSVAPILEKIIPQIPEGYVLQIVGHANAIGPEEPQPDGRPGNIYWSKMRARVVFKELVKQGLPADKMVCKAAGSSELDPRYPNPRDDRHIRVTLRIVPKEQGMAEDVCQDLKSAK
jgi:outer membrane protein OmpA-like peptidoglycan-associated protein